MAEDLLEHLSGLEQQLRDKLDGAVAEMAEKEVAELYSICRPREASFVE